jgi:outer membrane protein
MQRNKLMIKKVILTIFLLAAGKAYAQDSTRKINQFSLAQALDYAKQNSVQVKNALVDILIQKQVNRDVTSIALPQISGSAGMTHNFDIAIQTLPNFISQGTYNVLVNNNVADGNGNPIQAPADYGTIPFPLGNPWNASAGITLNQMIFDGQVFIALKARDGTMDLQRQIADLTEENISVNVGKVYYQLVVGKITVQLIDENISRLRKLHHDVTVMYDNGFAEKLDINKLNVQLANLETEKLRAENQIKNGYSGLKVLMGMPVKDSLVLTETLTEERISEGVLEASQFNYLDRKEFKIATLTNDLNKLNIRRYKLSQLPTLSLVGGYSKQAQRDQFDIFVKGDWFTSSYAGLQLRVPIFYGFSYRAKTEKARLELIKSQNQTEALKISIDDEIDNAKNNFATSIVSMNYQKKNMLLAEEVYDQTKKKYELGVASTTDINNTQTDLKTAQTNYLTAMYNAIIAKIDFLKATGKL